MSNHCTATCRLKHEESASAEVKVLQDFLCSGSMPNSDKECGLEVEAGWRKVPFSVSARRKGAEEGGET